MRYEKSRAEVVQFNFEAFMTGSGTPTYNTPEEALNAACGGYNGGGTNNFTCLDFGGYNAANPPTQNVQVIIGDGQYTYVFDYKGNHWKLHK